MQPSNIIIIIRYLLQMSESNADETDSSSSKHLNVLTQENSNSVNSLVKNRRTPSQARIYIQIQPKDVSTEVISFCKVFPIASEACCSSSSGSVS